MKKALILTALIITLLLLVENSGWLENTAWQAMNANAQQEVQSYPDPYPQIPSDAYLPVVNQNVLSTTPYPYP